MNDFASKKRLRKALSDLAKTLFLAKTLRSANDAGDVDFEILNDFFNDPQEGLPPNFPYEIVPLWEPWGIFPRSQTSFGNEEKIVDRRGRHALRNEARGQFLH